VTQLGRWHKADFSDGFSLSETDNSSALCEFAAMWADMLEIHTALVNRRRGRRPNHGQGLQEIT
jgi:Protein of unknown function (DUF3303)